MNEGSPAVAGGCANDPFGFDGASPRQQVRHEAGGLHKGESYSTGSDRGFASLRPRTDAASSLDELMRAMIEAMVDAHTTDPELYELLLTEVPHRAGGTKGFAVRLHGAFLLAISSGAPELKKRGDLDKVVFVVTHMAEALSHGAILRRPPGLSLAEAKAEIVRAVLAYLHA
jgi:hypothetical protein